MKTVTFFEVTKNSDSTEGRGHTLPTGIAFTEKDKAVEFACSDRYKPFAVMGCAGKYSKFNVRKVTTVVYDDLSDYDNNSDAVKLEQTKSNALEKLTKEEIEALKELGF